MLGYTYGDKWLLASIAFTIVGVGLTLLAVVSMAKRQGNIFTFTSLAGDRLSKAIVLIIALCIGPLGAIPRTAATSFETVSYTHLLAHLLENKNVKVSKIASGIPVGSNLEYFDQLTLERALEDRREI